VVDTLHGFWPAVCASGGPLGSDPSTILTS
jgi:hypothetical protein